MVLSQCDSPFVTKYYGSYLKVSIYLSFILKLTIARFILNGSHYSFPPCTIDEDYSVITFLSNLSRTLLSVYLQST